MPLQSSSPGSARAVIIITGNEVLRRIAARKQQHISACIRHVRWGIYAL